MASIGAAATVRAPRSRLYSEPTPTGRTTEADENTKKQAGGEAAVLEKIAAWPAPYRAMGERIHEIILDSVPELRPTPWFGMPGYAKGGPVLCFFRVDEYMSFGLTEKANSSVEDGTTDQLMNSAWFLTKLNKATEERIAAIVRKAAG